MSCYKLSLTNNTSARWKEKGNILKSYDNGKKGYERKWLENNIDYFIIEHIRESKKEIIFSAN